MHSFLKSCAAVLSQNLARYNASGHETVTENTTMKAHDFQKAREFLGKTFFAPAVSDSGVLIRFVEIDNWLRVMIELGEDTTSDDLRTAIPLALLWRDKLLKSQGPWMGGGENPFLEELSNRQESGQSYNELANRINQRVGAYLQEFANYLKEFETMKHSFKTMLDFYLWQPEHNRFSYEHAGVLLKALSLKNSEIEEMLKIGLKNLQAGKPAFELGYPVSREKLISTLRKWRRGVKHQVLKKS